jgi:adenylate cyclase class IV
VPGEANRLRVAILQRKMAARKNGLAVIAADANGRTERMSNETEIKLRVKDVKALLARLRDLGARPVRGGTFGRTGKVHEWNVLFDTPKEDLRKRWQILRIRTEHWNVGESKRAGRGGASAVASGGERHLLTFKRPVRGVPVASVNWAGRRRYKVREEIELEIPDAASMTRVLQGLGMRGWFRYEKFRTTFRLPATKRWASGLLIELDETPIGTFVELEGHPAAIDRAARELGFGARDYVVSSYLSVYREDCQRRGKKPGDMIFAK